MTFKNGDLLKLKDIIGDKKKGIRPIIPVCENTWRRGIKEGRFPKPINIGKRAVAWRFEDIKKMMKKLEHAIDAK